MLIAVLLILVVTACDAPPSEPGELPVTEDTTTAAPVEEKKEPSVKRLFTIAAENMKNTPLVLSNDTYMVVGNCKIGGSPSYYAVWANITATASKGGIPEDDLLTVTFRRKTDTSKYDHTYFELEHVRWNSYTDFNSEDMFVYRVSTDNGETWSEKLGTIEYYELNGKTVYQSETNYGMVYRLISSDMNELVEDGATITDIKLMPYGEMADNIHTTQKYRWGGFRLTNFSIYGAIGDIPYPEVPETEYEKKDPAELRKTVYSYMKKMSQVKWTPSEDIVTRIDTSATTTKDVILKAGTIYTGIPYAGMGESAIPEFEYYFNDKGAYAGPIDRDNLKGNQCMTSVNLSLNRVYPHFCNIGRVFIQKLGLNGIVPLGDYKWEASKTDTDIICKESGRNAMFEAYAQLDVGDIIIRADSAIGHTRLIAEKPNVIKNKNGTVSAQSSIRIIEQAGGLSNGSTWAEKFVTFEQLYTNSYITATCTAYQDGMVPVPTLTIAGIPDDISKGLKGTFESDYKIYNVDMKITDKSGKTVFEDSWFPAHSDSLEYYDMSRGIIKKLEKGDYHISVTATVADDVVLTVLDRDFTK